MALGDLTSGINMLPNDAMQQGFQNYLKSQSNIAQMKGQQALKNINTVDQLLNVNMKGLQSKDMDQAVAARDNLVKQVAKWTAQDGPGDLSWEHQKAALAMKDQLENMAQQSKNSQQLYNTRFQQIMGMKDKNAQQQAFKNLNQAYNMPTIEQRFNALNNPDLIPAPTYSLRDMAKNEYHLVTPEPTPQNVKDLTTQFNGNLADGGSITSQKVQELVNKGMPLDQAKQQVFNNLKSQLLGGQTAYGKAYSTALAKQRARGAAPTKPIYLTPDVKDGNTITLSGVGGAKGYIPIGNFYDEKTKETYPNAQIVKFKNVKGVPMAIVVYSTTIGGSVTNKFGSGELTQIQQGKSKEYKSATVPASSLRNFIKDKNINFKNAPWMSSVIQGTQPEMSTEAKSVLDTLSKLF